MSGDWPNRTRSRRTWSGTPSWRMSAAIPSKTQNLEQEINVLRSTTENFLKKNNHIFNLAGLPKLEFK